MLGPMLNFDRSEIDVRKTPISKHVLYFFHVHRINFNPRKPGGTGTIAKKGARPEAVIKNRLALKANAGLLTNVEG
jgi:hypothetical protein